MDVDCGRFMNGTTKFVNPLYGVCYSFNFVGTDEAKEARTLSLPGPFYGLTMEVDVGGDYYLREGQTEESGVALIIHDPEKIPLVSTEAIDILPNTETSIRLQEILIHRQPAPFESNCTSTWNATSLAGKVKVRLVKTCPYSVQSRGKNAENTQKIINEIERAAVNLISETVLAEVRLRSVYQLNYVRTRTSMRVIGR